MSDVNALPAFDTTSHGHYVLQAAEKLLKSGQVQELSVQLHGGSRYDWVHAIRRPEGQTYVVELLAGGEASSNPSSASRIIIVPLWLIAHVAGRQDDK